MNEYQQHYYDFQTGYWADKDPNKCRCGGRGWALSEVDTWHKCPYHKGHHPECECAECMGEPVPVLDPDPPPDPTSAPATDEDVPF